MKERVLVAMSGGLDSSMAAVLLKQQGYEVMGITMDFNLGDSRCIEDARRIAIKLNIPHRVINMRKSLEKHVIKDFYKQYLRGKTPNPCIKCNQFIKFDALLTKANALRAKFLATGHYARVVNSNEGYLLKKGKDSLKDQSYFLYRLNQKKLQRILFPLGDYTKTEIRDLAKKFRLPVTDRPASQEVCFLENKNYREFIKSKVKKAIKPGYVVDRAGSKLGMHKGIAFYTIGQREGLNIAKGYPLYITDINSRNNQITVGKREEALRKEFLIGIPHFILRDIKKKIALGVRIRYNHKEAQADITPFQNKIKVKFKKAQFAITPGQSAVFYDKDTVLGGGYIDKVLS